MIQKISILHKPVNWNQVSPVAYFKGNLDDFIQTNLIFDCFLKSEPVANGLVVNVADKTIKRKDGGSFITDGWIVGNTFQTTNARGKTLSDFVVTAGSGTYAGKRKIVRNDGKDFLLDGFSIGNACKFDAAGVNYSFTIYQITTTNALNDTIYETGTAVATGTYLTKIINTDLTNDAVTRTIDTVTDDTITITGGSTAFAIGGTFANSLYPASVNLNSPFTNIDLLFNLTKNEPLTEDYKSLIDEGTIQKFYLGSLDGVSSTPAVLTTMLFPNGGNDSKGWITGTSQIKAVSYSGFKQRFEIQLIYKVVENPSLESLQNKTLSNSFISTQCLNFVSEVTAKFNSAPIDRDKYKHISNWNEPTGVSGGYRENFNQGTPEYTLVADSLKYRDGATLAEPVLQSIKLFPTSIDTLVYFKINSASGKFIKLKTGTITTTVISDAVVGVGTAFTTELNVGTYLFNNAGSYIGQVLTITDNLNIVLSSNALVAVTGATYKASSVKGILTFRHCPLNESQYVGTTTTNYQQNFRVDKVVLTDYLGGNGDQSSTDYQAISLAGIIVNSATEIIVYFRSDFSAGNQTFFESLDEDDRNFLITFATEDTATTTTELSDRVSIDVACNNMIVVIEDETLVDIDFGTYATPGQPHFAEKGLRLSTPVAFNHYITLDTTGRDVSLSQLKDVTLKLVVEKKLLQVPYDNLAVSTFQVGETISNLTQTLNGIIVSDDAGILTIEAYEGTAEDWQDNDNLEGQTSLTTADIDGVSEEDEPKEFILDSFKFDFTNLVRVAGITQVNETIKRRDDIIDGVANNEILIIRRADLDAAGLIYYEVQFATIIGYEYWLKLIGADTEFFDNSEPENNLNKEIFHYQNGVLGQGWQVKYKIVLNVINNQNTVKTGVINEYNYSLPVFVDYTTGGKGIYDYNSNPNWEQKTLGAFEETITPNSIKTGVITTSTASTNVVGVGTLFTTELVVGGSIYKSDGVTLIGIILTITDNLNFVLTANAAVTVASQPFNASGTITSTLVSTAVVGVGTAFTTELNVGAIIRNSSGVFVGFVDTITDNLNLVLVNNAATAVTGAAYKADLKQIAGSIDYIWNYKDSKIVSTFKATGPTPPLGFSALNLFTLFQIETFEDEGRDSLLSIGRAIPSTIFNNNIWKTANNFVSISKIGNLIIATAYIDYRKLPKEKKFTIYSLWSLQNADFEAGDALKLDVLNLGTIDFDEVDIVDKIQPDCCSQLTVFADELTDSSLKNDRSGFLYFGNNTLITAITLVLQKYENGTWTYKETINNNDFGNFKAFGFRTDEDDNDYTEFIIDWKKVYLDGGLGAGDYRIKATQTGVGAITQYSFEYCLKKWHKNLAEGYVLLEYYNTGSIGERIKNKIPFERQFVDYGSLEYWENIGGTGFYNSIRLKGKLGQNKAELIQEFTQFSDQRKAERKFISRSQTPVYTLELDPLEEVYRIFIEDNVMMADSIFITDYNKRNANTNVQIQVNPKSGFEPKYTPGAILAPLTLEFENANNNKRKKS